MHGKYHKRQKGLRYRIIKKYGKLYVMMVESRSDAN